MKGLLIKDYMLLKNQKSYFMTLFLTFTVISIVSKSFTMIITTVPIILSMFTLSTISYDEFDNGNDFLFTLPFSRNQYVISKYIFGMSVGSMTSMFATILVYFIELKMGLFDNGLFEVMMAALCMLNIFLAVMVPIQLKFGSERGRLVNFIALVIIGSFASLTMYILKLLSIDITQLLIMISLMSKYIVMSILLLISLSIIFISMLISFKIMHNKQF